MLFASPGEKKFSACLGARQRIEKYIMKNLFLMPIAALALAFAAVSCTSTNTDNSLKLAQEGKTSFTYAYGGASKDALHTAAINALRLRNWQIDNDGNPILAHYDKGYQHAVVSIAVSDGSLSIDTKGSTWQNKPYVPINYLKYLKGTIDKTVQAK